MSTAPNDLPDDVPALKALVISLRENEARLEHIIAQFQRAQFGPRSEKLSPEQYGLALEDMAIASGEAEALGEQMQAAADEAVDPGTVRKRKRRDGTLASLPPHLERIEEVVAPDATECPCCGGALHQIGEDRADRLDKIPAQYRVIVTVRPKMACRSCNDGVVQAPAPVSLVPGGPPTEALVADLLVMKYADHMPLYRVAQMMKRQVIEIDRATLANWVGRAAAVLKPIVAVMKADLLGSERLFVDETTVKVLAPGTGKTKTGYFWAIARDDRAHGGITSPGLVYTYATGRGGVWAEQLLGDFHGIVQCDGYAVYKTIEAPGRRGGAGTLAFCWAHVRRKFFDIAKAGNAPIADEALARIARLYHIESEIRGKSPAERAAARQLLSAPLISSLDQWFDRKLTTLFKSSKTAEAIRYAVNHRKGLSRFLIDGRIELDNNTVERAMRPVARRESLCKPSSSVCKHWKRVSVGNATRATFPGHRRLDRLRRQVVGTDLMRCTGNDLRSRKDAVFDKAPYRVVGDA